MHLAATDCLGFAGASVDDPRKHRGKHRRLLPRGVAPLAADGAEADAAGEGGQPA
jgi:hypothetical protein